MASLLNRFVSNGLIKRSISTSNGAFSAMYTVMHNWPPEKFDKHFIDYFSRPEIDGWEVRKGLTELQNFDLIPDPHVAVAALRACRRVNDIGLAIRFLEALKFKCGRKKTRDLVYPWIIDEIKPVLDELGIPTLEELGYDQPEFFVPDADFWWEKKWYKDYGYDKMPGYQHFA